MKINRDLKTSFNDIGHDYDKFRLDYPSEVLDYIISKTSITPQSKILEIGAGTGIASLAFAKRGFSMTMVDSNNKPLALTKSKLSDYDNMKYIESVFENVQLPATSFDFIFSAQAFHWIDPAKGFTKVHSLLAPNGFFAVFWNLARREESPLLKETRKLYEKYCPGFHFGEARRAANQLLKSNLFKNGEKKSFGRVISFSKKYYVEMIQTYSWVASLSFKRRKMFLTAMDNLLDKFKEPIKIPYETILAIAQKQD